MRFMPVLMDLIPPTPMEEFFWSLGIYTTGAKIALFAGVFAAVAVAVFLIIKAIRKNRGGK